MQNNQRVIHLQKIVANSFALSLKLQNYHWNVQGQNFKPLHELFGEQYEELSDAIDDLAERVRALGSKVEATFNAFSRLSQAKEGDHDLDANKMVQDLLNDHESLVKMLNEGIQISQGEGDEATADMFIARIQEHEKAAWMLRSSI